MQWSKKNRTNPCEKYVHKSVIFNQSGEKYCYKNRICVAFIQMWKKVHSIWFKCSWMTRSYSIRRDRLTLKSVSSSIFTGSVEREGLRLKMVMITIHMVEYDWPIITKSQVSGLKIGENIISLVMTIRIVYVSENICKKSFQSFYMLFLSLLCVPLPSSYWCVRNEVVMIGIKLYVIAFFEKCICLCENSQRWNTHI